MAEQVIGGRAVTVGRRTIPWDVAAPISVAVIALAVRVLVLLLSRGSAIDMDGTEYVRMAQNIAAGDGPVGMRGITMHIFPLLFSWLIAGLTFLGITPEMAAHAVAVASGSAFAMLLYVLGSVIYGRRIGLYAGLTVAVLPACVTSSTSVISEPLFTALAVTGLLGLVLFVRRPSLREAAWCGAAFGLAFMVRPEGALLAVVAVAIALWTIIAERQSVRYPAILAACAFIAALPALISTYAITGHVGLEGKSTINFQLGERLRSGASYLSVADAVDEAGRPVGPEIDPRYLLPNGNPPTVAARDRVALIAGAAVRHVRDIAYEFKTREFGAGILIVLSLLGLIIGPWPRARRRDELILAAYFVTSYAALTSVWHFWPRYAEAFLPIVIVWAARGIGVLGRWSTRARLPDAGIAVLALILIGSVTLDVTEARANGPALERRAGALIASHDVEPASVVDVTSLAAYYAGATWSPLPYGDESAAARYLTALRPTYIVIDSSREADYPPLRAWFEHGLPPALATRVDAVADRGRSMVIYRFGPAR